MLVELVLRGPNDDDDFEVKFLKRFNKLGNGFVYLDREVLSRIEDRKWVVCYQRHHLL